MVKKLILYYDLIIQNKQNKQSKFTKKIEKIVLKHVIKVTVHSKQYPILLFY